MERPDIGNRKPDCVDHRLLDSLEGSVELDIGDLKLTVGNIRPVKITDEAEKCGVPVGTHRFDNRADLLDVS